MREGEFDKMARWAEDKAVELVLFLMDFRETRARPFEGTARELAEEAGIAVHAIGQVLMAARSPEFVQKYGYVIPYVSRGPGPKPWVAVTDHEPEHLAEIKNGERIRKDDAITAMRRVLAQSEFRAPSYDSRTRLGKREREALIQLEAALISLEQSTNSA